MQSPCTLDVGSGAHSGARSGVQRLLGILCAVGDEAYRLIPLLSYRLLGGLWVEAVCGKCSALAKGHSWAWWSSIRILLLPAPSVAKLAKNWYNSIQFCVSPFV